MQETTDEDAGYALRVAKEEAWLCDYAHRSDLKTVETYPLSEVALPTWLKDLLTIMEIRNESPTYWLLLDKDKCLLRLLTDSRIMLLDYGVVGHCSL